MARVALVASVCSVVGRMLRTAVPALACAGLLCVATGSAQEKPAPAPAAGRGAAPPPPPPDPSAPYTYNPAGRRDPFVSLLSRGSEPQPTSARPAGLSGLVVSEVSVKGIIRDRSGFIAMVQGPGTKTFIVRPGEKLMDGSIKAITADTVVFSEDVNDPLSMVKQKEVRKTVRPADGGR